MYTGGGIFLSDRLLIDKENIIKYYTQYVSMVYRICFTYTKNKADTEDIVQETFIRLMNCGKEFESDEHIKSWLIVTSGNLCKNLLRHWWRRNKNIDDANRSVQIETDDTINAILDLPDKYKTVIYMYYYEGYSSAEIAKQLGKTDSAVRTRLKRGRQLLKNVIGGEIDE